MTTCPVCGMQIDERSARKVVYGGRTYAVASDDCKTRFEADPEKYISMNDRPAHDDHSHKHGCC